MNKVSVEKLLQIGIALSKEKDTNKLFEFILTAAMDITNCDGGTLYRKLPQALEFSIMFTRSQNVKKGGQYEAITLPPVPLCNANVCARAAIDKELINIPDVYQSDLFDFSGPKKYDQITGYKTTSMLVVPMEDDEGKCIGVLQLINAMNNNGAVIAFEKECEDIILSLASQAAICQVNTTYAMEIQELLDSLVRVMSTTIDALTPYNANHTRNMVKYCDRFLEWLNSQKDTWHVSDRVRKQIIMSIWLHDAGKITVPLDVMDKDTRLGAKLSEVMDRFRIIELLYENEYLKNDITEEVYQLKKSDIDSARQFILQINKAGFLPDEAYNRVQILAQETYQDENGEQKMLLDSNDVDCLSVRKGTLTDAERSIMEGHVVMTGKMLNEIKFPSSYVHVRDWAAKHHELLNGTGYPLGLEAQEISAEVRLITILDVFDALTARDRPYKPAMPLDKALKILDAMRDEGKLDGEILELFKNSKAWE